MPFHPLSWPIPASLISEFCWSEVEEVVMEFWQLEEEEEQLIETMELLVSMVDEGSIFVSIWNVEVRIDLEMMVGGSSFVSIWNCRSSYRPGAIDAKPWPWLVIDTKPDSYGTIQV